MEPLFYHRRTALSDFDAGLTVKRAERRMRVFMHATEMSAGREAVRGFTLIELLVVLAIIIALTGIVTTSQSSFNKTLILSNTAYDIALSLRSAETYGLGGKAITTMPVGYGLHFGGAMPASSYILFADSYPAASVGSACHYPSNTLGGLDAQPGNCSYELGDTVVSTYTLWNGITIKDFCAYTTSWSCASTGLTSLDIVFARPNPDTLMSAGGSYSASFPVTRACITLQSPQGGLHFVSVESSGVINANATQCPLP